LRKKAIDNGLKYSLYLDFYPPIQHPTTGKETRREFLKLHLFAKPKTREEKQHNKETEAKANQILLERTEQMKNPQKNEKPKNSIKVLEFARGIELSCEGFTRANWQTANNYLQYFLQELGKMDMAFSEVNLQFCKDYRQYLSTVHGVGSELKPLCKNTRALYFSKFKTIFKKAFEDEYIETDFTHALKSLPTTQTKREYLTLEELKTLAQTPCKASYIKNASLFSALTGLRFSDVAKMVWGEIRESSQAIEIHYTQEKTGETQVHPISKQAFELLGERKADQERIFKKFKRNPCVNRLLKKWVEDAGISKKITFHCFRHTFATLQLEAGTDLYTVSKLLGHSDISTTQIYAQIVDKTKREAVDRIVI
jgi:integrase